MPIISKTISESATIKKQKDEEFYNVSMTELQDAINSQQVKIVEIKEDIKKLEHEKGLLGTSTNVGALTQAIKIKKELLSREVKKLRELNKKSEKLLDWITCNKNKVKNKIIPLSVIFANAENNPDLKKTLSTITAGDIKEAGGISPEVKYGIDKLSSIATMYAPGVGLLGALAAASAVGIHNKAKLRFTKMTIEQDARKKEDDKKLLDPDSDKNGISQDTKANLGIYEELGAISQVVKNYRTLTSNQKENLLGKVETLVGRVPKDSPYREQYEALLNKLQKLKEFEDKKAEILDDVKTGVSNTFKNVCGAVAKGAKTGHDAVVKHYEDLGNEKFKDYENRMRKEAEAKRVKDTETVELGE